MEFETKNTDWLMEGVETRSQLSYNATNYSDD